MKFTVPFSEDEIRRSHSVPRTLPMVALAWFTGVQADLLFVDDLLNPATKAHSGGSQRDEVILDLYAAIVGFTACLNALRARLYVQGIASCARSLLDLYVDLQLVHRNAVPDAVEKFAAFVAVERLASARALVEYCEGKAADYTGCAGIDEVRAWVNNKAAAALIDGSVTHLWGKRRPWHWSGINRSAARAEAAGDECRDLHTVYYKRFSWFVHTASIATIGVPPEDLDVMTCSALELVRTVVPNAFDVIGAELGLNRVIKDYAGKVEYLRMVPGIALADLQLQTLGEPQRFALVPDNPAR